MTDPGERAEYAAYFCEENIYRLASARLTDAREAPAVVLISNAARTVAVGAQRAGHGPERIVIWDYHVIYVEDGLVFDLDTAMSYPVGLADYTRYAFPGPLQHPDSPYAALFSVVPASDFVNRFSSDRAHMRREAGSYRAPPPPWPPIYRPEEGHNLFAFVDGAHETIVYHGPVLAAGLGCV